MYHVFQWDRVVVPLTPDVFFPRAQKQKSTVQQRGLIEIHGTIADPDNLLGQPKTVADGRLATETILQLQTNWKFNNYPFELLSNELKKKKNWFRMWSYRSTFGISAIRTESSGQRSIASLQWKNIFYEWFTAWNAINLINTRVLQPTFFFQTLFCCRFTIIYWLILQDDKDDNLFQQMITKQSPSTNYFQLFVSNDSTYSKRSETCFKVSVHEMTNSGLKDAVCCTFEHSTFKKIDDAEKLRMLEVKICSSVVNFVI